MINNLVTEVGGIPVDLLHVEACIILYVRTYGQIKSINRWAHELGYDPAWVNYCAHSAERKKLLKLTRLPGEVGRPYRVTLLEERT